MTPPLEVEIDAQETAGKAVIRLQVPRGDDPPYAIDDNKIYVRDEAETTLAVRDEIVRLVQRNTRPIPAPHDHSLDSIDTIENQPVPMLPGSEVLEPPESDEHPPEG